jgi:hypothetical protein
MTNSFQINDIAADVWAAIPGSYADQSKTLALLIAALRQERLNHKPASTITRQTEEELVAKMLLKPLAKLNNVTVPICGISVKASQVFQVAKLTGHPLHSFCAEFITKHGLYLKPVRVGNGPATNFVFRDTGADDE